MKATRAEGSSPFEAIKPTAGWNELSYKGLRVRVRVEKCTPGWASGSRENERGEGTGRGASARRDARRATRAPRARVRERARARTSSAARAADAGPRSRRRETGAAPGRWQTTSRRAHARRRVSTPSGSQIGCARATTGAGEGRDPTRADSPPASSKKIASLVESPEYSYSSWPTRFVPDGWHVHQRRNLGWIACNRTMLGSVPGV